MAAAMLIPGLSGCAKPAQTGLGADEEELVAEYAAGMLMKYSAYENGGLGVYVPKPAEVELPPAETEAPAPTPAPETDEQDGSDIPQVSEDIKAEDLPEPPEAAPGGTTMCEAIGIPGFDMEYTGYEVADVYPEPGSDELSFSMQAAEGRKLLVVHLDVINPDGSDKECSVLDSNIKFRILINDSVRVNEQMTILLNDLKSFSDTIPANGKVDTVLVFEVDSDDSEGISALDLIVVGSEGESRFKLL